jgi:outer membrane lipoprotein-sorting protein
MKKTMAALLMLACTMLMLSACAAQRPSAAAQTNLAQLERQAN